MDCACDQIDLPVLIIKTLLHHLRTFFDADAVLNSPAPAGETPIDGLTLCLLMAVATLAAAATNLETDCAEITTKALRDPSLIASLFTHPFYRVSFFLT